MILNRFYCLLIAGLATGSLLCIHGQDHIRITHCDINNNATAKTFRDYPVCEGLTYQKNICFCHMDQCLEAARYSHIKTCGYTTLPAGAAPVTEETVVDNNDTLATNETELTEAELVMIYAEMFNHTMTTTTTTTTTTTEDINILIMNNGLAPPIIVRTDQFGVNINGDAINICDCQDELPEVLEFKVVLKKTYWNPLFADFRTSVSKELKSSIEQELQLLISSSNTRISRGRSKNEAKNSIELEVLKFSEHFGVTLTTAQLNLTESHFDNDLAFETEFRQLIEKYNNFNGTGVFGATFKRYSKHTYDSTLKEVYRVLPVSVESKTEAAPVIEEDPMEMLRFLGLPVSALMLVLAGVCCIRSCYCKHWC